jgi:hypothetical protein
MKTLASLVFFLATSPAFAISAPGGPPWSCRVIAACKPEDTCVATLGLPLNFSLRIVDNQDGKFIFESQGSQRIAMLSSSEEDAKRALENDSLENRVAIALVRTNRVADAHSFWAYPIYSRGTGERFLSEERMLIACNTTRAR